MPGVYLAIYLPYITKNGNGGEGGSGEGKANIFEESHDT